MIHVIKFGIDQIALVVPVRELRAAVPARDAITDHDGNILQAAVAAIPAETPEEYAADIIAGALAGLPAGAEHVATMDAATVAALLSGPAIDTDESDALQVGADPRAYRAALTWTGAALVAPAAKRRAALLNKLREKRDRALTRSDALIARATEQGNTAAADALRAYRQALRDLPTTWDGNPATLAAAWPQRPSV